MWQARSDGGAATPSSEALFDAASSRPDALDVAWRTTLATPQARTPIACCLAHGESLAHLWASPSQVIAAAGRHPSDWVAACGRDASHITVCVPNSRRFSGQPPHAQLQHPTPVLAASWRPGAAAAARVLLTFCSDSTARLWAQPPGSDAAGRGGMPSRLLAVACIAADAAAPPAWLTASPGASPLLCGPGPDGRLHLWAVLCVDQPHPRPAVRVVPVSRTEAGVMVAPRDSCPSVQLRLAPNARPGALPTSVLVWGLDGGGQASLVKAPLASMDQAEGPSRPPRESFGGGVVDAIAASVGGITSSLPSQAGVQRQSFALDGHVGRITLVVAPPPGPPDTSTDDVLLLTLETEGVPRLWRATCRGDITPAGLLPLFPADTSQALAAVSPSHSIFVVAASDGLAAYALRGRRTCTPFASLQDTGGLVRALALVAPSRLVLGAGHPPDAPDPCGIVAALTHGGAAVRVWALQLTHAQAVGAILLAAWDLQSPATCLGAPTLLPHEDGDSLPYALATAGEDGVVRLWAPPSQHSDAQQTPCAWHVAGVCPTDSAQPRTLACSPGGGLLAVADAAGGCALWACDSTACRAWTRHASLSAAAPDAASVNLAWLHTGAAPPLLALTRGDCLQVWAPSRRRGLRAGSWAVLASTAATSQQMPLLGVAWHPYGALVASAGQELWAVSPVLLAPPSPPGLDVDDEDHGVPLVSAGAETGGPAAAWHPVALGEAIRGGDVARAVLAVRTLADHLRELDTSPHPSMAGQLPDDAGTGVASSADAADGHALFAPGASLPEHHPASSSSARAALFTVAEAEEVAHLVSIAPAERLSPIQPEDTLAMLAALDALAQADSRRSDALALDAPAQRCVAELSYANLCERTGDPAGASAARARASCWACHSSTQEPLLSACLGPGAAGTTWQALLQCGAPTWLPSLAVLRTALETCARNLYMARKDPGDAAALYCALGRTQVLSALYRTAGDKQMPGFLSRDFSDPKSRMAASKNAYALLGMNKHGLAVAFFLLAGAPGDAASIAARRLHDPQLAVAIARLADAAAGNERAWGTHCESLATEELLPNALAAGDLWTHHALLWRLGRTSDAIQLLLDAVSSTRQADLQECSTLARLLGHLGDSVRLRMANPQEAAACSAASRLAAHITARAAWAAGLPLQGLTWLAKAAKESADIDQPPPDCLDAHACKSYQHSAAVRMAAAALWHGTAFEAWLSPHSWQAGVAQELQALRPLLPQTPSQHQRPDTVRDCVIALLSRQLRVSHPPPPAPPIKSPSPTLLVHSASATLTPPPAAVTMRKSITVDTMQTPTGASHSRTNSLVGALSRLPVSGASQFFGSSPSMPALHRSMSAPTLQRDAVLAPTLEVLRAPGELLRGLALSHTSPSVVVAATLRSGLLVSDVRAHDTGLGDAMLQVGGDGGGSDAAAWAVHGHSWAGNHPGARGQPPHGPATLSPSEVHVRCVAMHPNEPIVAAGSAAVGAGISLWRLTDRPALRHVAPLPWPGHGGIAAAGPPVGAVTWDVSGARLGAAFADGTAAVWHVAAAGGAPYAWLSAFPEGMTHGITCLSPTVLALCGSGGDASLVLWDTLCPPKAQRVAAFAAHQGAPGASCLVRGCTSTTMVYTAGATAGDVAAFDLRAAAQSGAAAPLWRTPAGAVPASCLALAPWSSGDGTLFVGDRGGDLRVIEARTGRLLQLVVGVHPRGVFSPPQRVGGTAITAGVTSVLALPRGVLTCGADGALKLHAQEAGAL